MPTLRVLVGPTPSTLNDITSLVNTNTSHRIVTDAFEGQIVVFIKGFNQADPSATTPEAAEYFGRTDRSGITWSIQVQGRFLSPRSADDILFGNIFERPLKLPWGTAAALTFMKIIDPTLTHDLMSTQKPWALSPLVATMPYLKHTRLPGPGDTAAPTFPPPSSITDYTSVLHLAAAAVSRPSTPSTSGSGSSNSLSSRSSARDKKSKKSKKNSSSGDEIPRTMSSQQRRAYFSSERHRQSVTLGPQDMVTTDFCYGFLEFAPSLRLRLPGGLGFDLARYWDGQGVRFVCCERRQVPLGHDSTPIHEPEFSESSMANKEHEGGGEDPWGRVFWCVSIEMGEDDVEKGS
ncbi:DUF1769-domain-containing protein [Mycena rebaudengoi]|nr:DUF1769-domain-containing protein [Mycena rebaudengoi]